MTSNIFAFPFVNLKPININIEAITMWALCSDCHRRDYCHVTSEDPRQIRSSPNKINGRKLERPIRYSVIHCISYLNKILWHNKMSSVLHLAQRGGRDVQVNCLILDCVTLIIAISSLSPAVSAEGSTSTKEVYYDGVVVIWTAEIFDLNIVGSD